MHMHSFKLFCVYIITVKVEIIYDKQKANQKSMHHAIRGLFINTCNTAVQILLIVILVAQIITTAFEITLFGLI